jgi:nicotinate-nucleotide pyrophosphorylase (carboxylating)
MKDGEKMAAGDEAFEVVEARIHNILKCERLVLNCMQRMSGSATLNDGNMLTNLKAITQRFLIQRKTTLIFVCLKKKL